MTNIQGKVVAITGAGRGIGRAIALHLASHGAKVVLAARREPEIEAVALQVTASGGEAALRSTDVTRRADLQALVELACDRFGRLDVLVNNAGIGPISRFDALRVDEWDAMIDVNVKGTLYGIAAALPVFQRQNSGHVVNILSTAGIKILPSMGVYAATKNALRTATEALGQEAGPHMRVTEVSPGFVDSDFAESITDPAVRAAIEARKEAFAMPPEAIARAVAFAIEQPAEVEIGSIVRRTAAVRHDRAHGAGRPDERPRLSGLCRATAGAHACPGRDGDHGQPACPQGSGRAHRHRGGRGKSAPAAALQPRPQPDRAAFAKLKAWLRRRAARTISALWNAIAAALPTFSPAECANYFTACGYEPE